MTWFIGFPTRIRVFDKFISSPYVTIPLKRRHLTLVYLGQQRPPDNVLKIIEELNLRRFKVLFRGIKPFPTYMKPRYLVTVPVEKEKIIRIRDEIASVIPQYMISDKYTEYKPHVSIAFVRKKPDTSLIFIAYNISKKAKNVSEEINVTRICLYEAIKGGLRIVWSTPLK